jgi:hypothetical protein
VFSKSNYQSKPRLLSLYHVTIQNCSIPRIHLSSVNTNKFTSVSLFYQKVLPAPKYLIHIFIYLITYKSLYFNKNVYRGLKRLGRMDNTAASYSGGSGFKSRPGNRLCYLRFFGPSRQILNNTSKRATASSIHILSYALVTEHPSIRCYYRVG